jgi:hypothetical protein
MRDLPCQVPALVIIEMTDRELAQLDAAADSSHYPSVLSTIVRRIESDRKERN